MGLLVSPRWVLLATVALSSAGVAIACSAAPPGDPETEENSLPGDGGPALKIPAPSDNPSGCGTGGKSSTEVPGAKGCGTGGTGAGGTGGSGAGGTGGETTGCVPKGSTEASCGDGVDDDCDGQVDCDDTDCRHPGECGCQASELSCNDGADDDCDGKPDCADEECGNKCVPGAVRFCDEPNYCNWGQQSCGPDGNWGACVEVPAPSGCEGFFGFDNSYDQDCCVSHGFCCQAYPAQNSVGNCAGVNACG